MSPISDTPRLAYNLVEACEASGLSRSTFYRLAKTGSIKLHKVGSRTIVHADDLRRLLHMEAGQ